MLVGVIKDYRSILRPNVISLPISRRRIMDRKEDFEKGTITAPRRVKSKLNGLRMARSTPTDGGIIRMVNVSAAVTGQHRLHTVDLLEYRLQAPKAPSGKSCDLVFRCHGVTFSIHGPANIRHC